MWLCICTGRQFEDIQTRSGEKAYKCHQCDFASVQAGKLRTLKLTLEKSTKMQKMWLCISSSTQFEERVEKSVQVQPFATFHLFRQAIWENIWKLPQVKFFSNAINATMHKYRQAIWGHIWKLTLVKNSSYTTNAIMHLLEFAISRQI